MAKDLTSRQLALQAKVDSQTNTESIGSLDSLTTTDKTNIVASVNEIDSQLADKANTTQVMRKLISRTIAAGEEIAAITWTQDDAGNALALIEAEVRYYIPANSLAVGTTGFIYSSINDITSYYGADSESMTVVRSCLFRSVFGAGTMNIKKIASKVIFEAGYTYSDGTTRVASTIRGFLPTDITSINKIYTYINGLTYFPTGTVIDVYGRTE